MASAAVGSKVMVLLMFIQVALHCLSSWWLVDVVWLFQLMLGVCLQCVIVVFPDHTHYFLMILLGKRELVALQLWYSECHVYSLPLLGSVGCSVLCDYGMSWSYSLTSVNPEIFEIILFSRIALKYIFATLKNRH